MTADVRTACVLPAVLVAVLSLGSVDAHAQDANEDRRSVRVAAGILAQAGTFGDDHPLTSNYQPGATFSVGLRRHPMKRFGLAFEAALEPIAIDNPHLNERVGRRENLRDLRKKSHIFT